MRRAKQLRELGLHDGWHAAVHAVDLAGVDIHTDHRVAVGCEASGTHGSDVAQPEYRDLHERVSLEATGIASLRGSAVRADTSDTVQKWMVAISASDSTYVSIDRNIARTSEAVAANGVRPGTRLLL